MFDFIANNWLVISIIGLFIYVSVILIERKRSGK